MVESNITNTSRPYVRVELGPVDKQPFYVISTIQSETGAYDDKGKFTADGSALISSASINGMVPKGRKGSISIKDLTGIWPDRLADLGRYSADLLASPGPNMIFEYGWQGLIAKNNNNGGSMHTNRMSAFIESVKFDINDDASISITIDFVAYSSIVFSDIMAFDWNDIINSGHEKLWSSLTKVLNNEEPTPIDVINYVTNISKSSSTQTGVTYTDNINSHRSANKFYSDKYTINPNAGSEFSYAKALENRKLIIECRSTGYSAAKLKKDNDLISIEFGMPLVTWLNEVLAQVILSPDDQQKVEKDGLVVTYEKQNDEEIWIDGKLWTKVIYDWTAFPDPQDPDIDSDAVKTRYQKWMEEKTKRSKYINGPVMYWKAGQESYVYDSNNASVIAGTNGTQVEKKRILNWDSNLSSWTQLFRMFKDELSERLNDLKAKDNYDDFIKKLENYESIDAMEADLSKRPGFFERVVESVFRSKMEKRTSLIRTVQNADGLAKTIQDNNGNKIPHKDQTFGAIVAQNSFIVHIEVLGDPDLGTKYPGAETIITTDFSFAGTGDYTRKVYDSEGKLINIANESLVSMFSRQWILFDSEHTFGEDGSYTTKIKLQGYIPLAVKSDGEMRPVNEMKSDRFF